MLSWLSFVVLLSHQHLTPPAPTPLVLPLTLTEDLPSSGEKKQFLNKRAGHYNEFKVLQAMRAKLAAEEDEDEDEEDENDS